MRHSSTSTTFRIAARCGSGVVAAVLLTLGLSGGAAAQPSVTNTVTTSTSRAPDTFVDTILPTVRIDTFRTRILGLLQGDPTLYFDQSYAFAFADPMVQAGLFAAQGALDAASTDPLDFLGPTLTGSTSLPSSGPNAL